jgi:hypothetical protein
VQLFDSFAGVPELPWYPEAVKSVSVVLHRIMTTSLDERPDFPDWPDVTKRDDENTRTATTTTAPDTNATRARLMGHLPSGIMILLSLCPVRGVRQTVAG